MSDHHADHATGGDQGVSVVYTIAGFLFGAIIVGTYLFIMKFLLMG
ncbi:MAG: hypothetical protein Q4B48_00400 [Syntrophomonadaceae bacterium]|nr:hypothetical protein [Syntrophomonadaceae bacterium]